MKKGRSSFGKSVRAVVGVASSAAAGALIACTVLLMGCPSLFPTAVPAAPANVAVSIVTTGDGQLQVKWDSVPNATTYNLYWAAGSTVTTSTGTKIANATSPDIIDNLVAGAQYAFIVTASNALGESDPSGIVTDTITYNKTGHLYIVGHIWSASNDWPAYWKDGALKVLSDSAGYYGEYLTISGGDVYILGHNTQNWTQLVYWKNGVMTNLMDPGGGKTLQWVGGMAVVGSDVYVGATYQDASTPGAQYPYYWKNGGTPIALDTQGHTLGGYIAGVVSSGTDLYLLGTLNSNENPDAYVPCVPVYWKDGITTPVVLSQGTAYDGTPYEGGWIPTEQPFRGWAMSAGTLYTCSTVYGQNAYGQGGRGTYWQVGADTPIFVSAGESHEVYAMAVSGTSAYLAGATWDPADTSAPRIPKVWGPSGESTLNIPPSVGVTSAAPSAIAVSGSDVYVTAYAAAFQSMWTSSNPMVPLYWKNGSFIPLSLPSGYPNAILQGLGIWGTDAYVAGSVGTNDGQSGNLNWSQPALPVYWKNGNLNPLPLGEGSIGGEAEGLLVTAS